MKLAHRSLPRREQYPLPPRQITMNAASLAGIADQMDEEVRLAATLAAHFGYGTAMGAVYGVARGHSAHPPSGIVFGLSVWAGSYLGLLPACGLLNSATEHPIRRTALMVARNSKLDRQSSSRLPKRFQLLASKADEFVLQFLASFPNDVAT